MNDRLIYEYERLDDLECGGLKIIQDKKGYCFTSDSVLLSNLANVQNGDKVVDLGSGSGVVSLLVCAKHKVKKVVEVELQTRLADMAKRSVDYNDLSHIISVINRNMIGVEKEIGCDYDVVLSNPPYAEFFEKKEVYSESEICKSEVCITVDEVCMTASKLLRYGGLFYMVNKTRRLTDAVCSMRKYGIEPKKIWLVQPKSTKDFDSFIIEGKRGGKSGVVVPKPIIVYNEDGTYTDFARGLYNK